MEGEGKQSSIFSSSASPPSRPRLLPTETSRSECGSDLLAGSAFSRPASISVPSGLPLLLERDTRRLMPFFSLENESRIPMSVSGQQRVMARWEIVGLVIAPAKFLGSAAGAQKGYSKVLISFPRRRCFPHPVGFSSPFGFHTSTGRPRVSSCHNIFPFRPFSPSCGGFQPQLSTRYAYLRCVNRVCQCPSASGDLKLKRKLGLI